jgi:hypothetical protein
MQSYGNKFEIFTKHEVAYFDDFPKTKPDLYLRGDKEYLIVLAHDTPLFLSRKLLTEYITHFDEDGWTTGIYPTLLFIFADDNTRIRFQEYSHNLLESNGINIDELSITATTLHALRQKPHKLL